jgi:hypothetical protein
LLRRSKRNVKNVKSFAIISEILLTTKQFTTFRKIIYIVLSGLKNMDIRVLQKSNTLEKFLIDQGYTHIPMEKSVVGHFEIKAIIANQKVLLLLDTGASRTVLHGGTADLIGLSSKKESNCGGGLATTKAAVSSCVLDKLILGTIEFKLFKIHVMDFSHPISGIKARGGNRIDGVIGADILGPKSAIIDYENEKLYLKNVE